MARLCIFADFVGAIDIGACIKLEVTIIYGFFEEIAKKQKKSADYLKQPRPQTA